MACFTESLPAFLQFSNRLNNELSIVSIDHNYAKPWSTHPDASNARPRRMLFMEPSQRTPTSESAKKESESVDVDGEENLPLPLYDVSQSKTLMNDCGRHAALLSPDFTEMKDDWEDHIAIIRTTWTVFQNRIFAKVMRVLQSDHLARLTIQKTQNEPVQRRLQIDKAAKRVRYVFANVNWDISLILWLHNLFLEKLRGPLLLSYLEVLQTLKEKVILLIRAALFSEPACVIKSIPSLIECLVDGTVCKTGGLTKESLSALLKRTWDPVISNVNQEKSKKLPGNPLIIVVSNVPSSSNLPAVKRYKSWQHQLSCMGKVVNIVPVNTSTSITVADCVENMIASTRSKILEMKGHFPGRIMVLIGFHVGALVATQVALMEQVHAAVCIGYPILGVNGSRGDIDESVYNTKTPTLFVVGQHASSFNLDTLEDIREKLRVETGLVVVGGADDQLRMSRAKKKACSVTQFLVDKCIIDEITDFLGSTLSQAIIQPEIEEVDPIKKISRKRKWKETGLAVGSQTSELLKQVTSKQFKKALKYPKQDPLLSSASSTTSDTLAFDIPQTSPSSSLQIKPSKKPLSKKRCKGTSKTISGKRPLLHLKLQSSKARTPLPSLSKIEEAAAIASAPELSNLLQSMKPTLPSSFLAPKISPSCSPTSSVTTLPITAQKKSDPSSSALLQIPSSSEEDPLRSKSTVPCLRVEGDNSAKNELLAKQLSPNADDSGDSQQQTQILIHSCSSSQPISIPLSLAIGNKVLKSISNSTRLTPSCEKFPTGCSDGVSRLQSPDVPQTSLTNFSDSLQSHGKSTSPISVKLNDISEPQSPIASVISIGSDTVQMKETPPSITSAPGTVSIDLGQLATSNNIVMKFGTSSKISLIPSLKQVTPVCAGYPDNDKTITPSLSLSVDSGMKPSPTCISFASKTSSVLATGIKPQPIPVPSKFVSKSVDLSPKSSGKNLTLLSGSHLKSPSTNPSFITLKLSSPVSTSTVNEVEAIYGKSFNSSTESVGTNVTHCLKSLCNISSSNISSPKITLSSSVQKDVLSSTTCSEKASSSSLLSTGTTNMASGSSTSSGTPLLFNSRSSGTSMFVGASMALSKVMIGTGVETLGQVSSLLESSPVTMGDNQTAASDSSLQLHDANKCETSFSLAVSPQGLANTSRASRSTFSSYASLSKPVLPTVASTRTRRIKTPKQYDL